MKFRILDLYNDHWVSLLIVPFLGFCVPYLVNMTPEEVTIESFLYEHPSVFSVFVVVIIFETNRFFVKFFKNIILSFHKKTIYRVFFKFVFQLFLTFCLLFAFLSIWYIFILKLENYFEFLITTIFFGLTVTLIFLLSYDLSYFFYKWTEEQTRTKNLEIINSKAQINLMKNQLAPHFLFNSLSTLMSLVETNKESALNFINSFSSIYRYILENSDVISIAIKTELEFIEDYVAIYKANYGSEAINLQINIPEKYYKYELPKLSIQMLVENALKHNLFSNSKPLNLEIGLTPNKSHLFVKNNIQLKKRNDSTHIGLKNINERYKKMGKYKIIVENSFDTFNVKLPLLKP